MDKREQLRQALRDHMPPDAIQVYPAKVKSIQGNNCTVDLIGTDLTDVPDVNLRANDDAKEGVLVVPRVGSIVYVGTIENAVDNLFVCLVSEVDKVEIKINKVSCTVDKDGFSAKQDQTELTLKAGKITAKNSSTSLKTIFDDLTTLLTSFKVITPVQGAPTPSVSLEPGTTANVTKLKTTVSELLA